MANLTNFTPEEFSRVISGKAELYESALRNGYYLPKYKSGIINEAYITGVINGEIFCPKYTDIRLLPCPRPPDKDTLIGYARQIKTPGNKPLAIGVDDHTPDKAWLIVLLSTYKADLKIFKKDYVAPPKIPKID
jgi:hypothetical protein